MRSKLKLSRSLEFIPAFFKEQQVINTGAPVLIGLRLRATKSFFKAFSFAVLESFVINLLSYNSDSSSLI